jgi:hypothetical protein
MHDRPDSMPVTGSRRSCSYLLRLWQEEPGSPCRAMLRSVMTKEEHLFPDLEGLVTFLEASLETSVFKAEPE